MEDNILDKELYQKNPEYEILETASHSQRFANYIIDLVIVYLGCVPIYMFLILEKYLDPVALNIYIVYAVFFSIFFAYFILLESITGRTLGKLITRTEVVTVEGEKPAGTTIFLRTLCRLIPFDNISFLSGTAIGWHDSFTKTRVVKKK